MTIFTNDMVEDINVGNHIRSKINAKKGQEKYGKVNICGWYSSI